MALAIRKHFSKINLALKICVSLLALYYIGYRLANTTFNWQDVLAIVSLKTLGIIIVLTAINWYFEVLKWKVVIQTIEPISLKKAIYETFVAYTYGLVTPFNSGNYLKKIFFYAKKHRKKIVFLNLSKGIYQMITTLIFGSWGAYVLIDMIDLKMFNQKNFLIGTGIIGLIVFLVFRKKIINYTKSIPLKTHFKLFIYSVIKFFAFSSILLILLHKTTENLFQLYAGICLVFLLSSLLPILNILDFAIKGSIALLVFTPLGITEAEILISYFIIWICNHMFPAITGSIIQFYNPKKAIE